MIFVDTGFFLALSQPRDALHTRATEWARALTEGLLTTEYVLWETVNALSKPIDRPKAHILLAYVRSNPSYEVVPSTVDRVTASIQLHAKRTDKEWSLTDGFSFVVMEERDVVRALTHDRHFEQAGFGALLRRDPP